MMIIFTPESYIYIFILTFHFQLSISRKIICLTQKKKKTLN